jgi:hypothetical protein
MPPKQKPLDKSYTDMITYIMLSRQIILPRLSPTKLTPLLRYSCSLLPLFLRAPSFVFNSSQPLLPKTGGWGYLQHSISVFAARSFGSRYPLTPLAATHTKNSPLSPLAATHTKTPSCKSFPCHTYKKQGVSPQLWLTRILVSDPFGASVSLWPKTPSLSNFPTFRPSARFQLECL